PDCGPYDHLPPYWHEEVLAITSGDVTYPRPPLSSLTDSFGGTEINPCLWWVGAAGGASAREDGSLILSLPDGPGSQVFVRSQDLWSLADSSAVVEVPEVVGPGASNMFLLSYSDEPGHESLLQFWYEGSSLFCNVWADGHLQNVATVPYSPTDHLW